ncbi:asparaginase domain-containing protein [Solemya elarraichensis gill symbiont]|uniref:L-asparaginase N-terminal domain-containing protein n=1 Tax=Solemya elarraichensis gill symbiont TaxID=1918949 RepID=A0A1T2L9K3_9GAMM|nr:asparaginase domain-containing protein [Solemya elarraichensis gill symbiont]OOZ41798.1 hypothetical protein BOW52_04130 [Solemya elarraichensis gill symbiont]
MRILVTGGTIDKCYLETDGKLWFQESIIGDMLKQGRCTADTSETAAEIAALELDKTIVLTGSMIPHRVGNSDALFNLGCAVAAVQLLPHSVYLAINGETYEWDRVVKNRDLGRFARTAEKH